MLETSLVWARWGVVVLCLALAPIFPTVPAWWTLLPGLVLALGNAGLWWLLRQPRSAERLRQVGWLATGLEWAVGLAILLLFRFGPPGEVRVDLVLLLIMAASVRFGLSGLGGATAGGALVVGALVGAQVLLRGQFDASASQGLQEGWPVSLVAVLLIAGLVGAREQWRRWAEAQWQSEHEAVQRLRFGLSAREWSLLPLLCRDELTYEQIGAALGISAETVKTHVRRIGEKFGVSGRRGVVAAARQNRLVPIAEPNQAPANPPAGSPDSEPPTGPGYRESPRW